MIPTSPEDRRDPLLLDQRLEPGRTHLIDKVIRDDPGQELVTIKPFDEHPETLLRSFGSELSKV